MALTNDNKIIKIIKIELLGSAKTGKITILRKLIDKKVDKDLEYISTIGGSYTTYNIEFEHENFNLKIWNKMARKDFIQ